MFNRDIYISRRKELKLALGKGMILLPGNEESSMNYKDNLYPFRQDSTFLYFTGIDRPNLFLIIDIDNEEEIIFGNDLTIEETVWTGPAEALALQAEKAGIKVTKPLSALAAVLQGNKQIHYLPPYRPETAIKLSEYLQIPYQSLKEQASVALIKAIVKQRSVKSDVEVAEIEKAIDITVQMQTKAMQLAMEGISEYEIAGYLQGIAVSGGGHLAFPTILTVNGQFLHNHASANILQNGQMVLCDCGAESAMHYAGDLTRTFPVAKTFTPSQKEIYEIVLNANQSAIAALRPGKLFKEVHLLACEKLAEGLKNLGLMKGDVSEAVAQGAHTLFFQCGLGHMLGLDVHDMENLGEEYVGYTEELKKSKEFGLKSLRLGRALESGFVVTIEPGIYFIPDLIDSWQAEKRHEAFINYEKVNQYKDFGGIRIEDDVLITDSGSRILGAPLPKTVAAIEAVY